MVFLSVVVPLYNEEKRLDTYFPILLTSLKKIFIDKKFEIILVNDGSGDLTLSLIESIAKDYSELVKVVTYNENKGKGFALKSGVLMSSGEYVVFTDVDLSVKPDILIEMLPLVEAKYDLVVGSRHMLGSKIVVRQTWIRELLGKCYVLIANLLFQSRWTDFTCGFKVFKRDAALTLFSNLTCYRWSFDAEILALARYYNFSVVEYPVEWHNNFSSKVRIVRDVFISFFELLVIWKQLVCKNYAKRV